MKSGRRVTKLPKEPPKSMGRPISKEICRSSLLFFTRWCAQLTLGAPVTEEQILTLVPASLPSVCKVPDTGKNAANVK